MVTPLEELVIPCSPRQAPKNLSPPHSALEVVENLRAQRVETAKAARRSGMVSIRRQREAECSRAVWARRARARVEP